MTAFIFRNLPFIIFPWVTLCPIAIIHFRAQRSFYRSIRELENEYGKTGVKWEYSTGARTHFTLFNQDDAWIKSDDAPSIQDAKRVVLQRRKEIGKTLKPIITIALIGLALSAVAAVFTQR